MSCTEHLDSPGNVQQIRTAYADSPSEAVIASGMSSPAEPQSTAMPKPSSIGNVLTKGPACVPCSPTVQALAHSESDLCHKECNVILNLSSSPTHCVDLDKTLVPIECKCALSCLCHMGFNPGDHYDCASRKEYASLLHRVQVLEKALQYQIAQGRNSLLPCHSSQDSPSDVEDNKAEDSVLGLVPECSADHCHSPSLDPVSMAMAQGESGYQSPVDNVSMSTEVGSSVTVFEPDREVLSCQSPVLSKDVNSGVSHSADQFHKTSTPKSPKVYLALTELSISDCHQSPIRQLHFDSLQPGLPSPLSMVGHCPTNALDKNNGTKAQVATGGDPDLSNDLGPGALPSRVPNDDPQADSSLCEYPGPSYSSSEQCGLEYSLSESEQALSSSGTCTSQELFHSSSGCSNLTSTTDDCLGSCHGQFLLCDHSADDHSGLLSHGWSASTSGLSGSMGHSKPTQFYDDCGSSGHEVSQKVFSQSSIDVIPLNRIGLV